MATSIHRGPLPNPLLDQPATHPAAAEMVDGTAGSQPSWMNSTERFLPVPAQATSSLFQHFAEAPGGAQAGAAMAPSGTPAAAQNIPSTLTDHIARSIAIYETNRGGTQPIAKESSLDTTAGIHASVRSVSQATVPWIIDALEHTSRAAPECQPAAHRGGGRGGAPAHDHHRLCPARSRRRRAADGPAVCASSRGAAPGLGLQRGRRHAHDAVTRSACRNQRRQCPGAATASRASVKPPSSVRLPPSPKRSASAWVPAACAPTSARRRTGAKTALAGSACPSSAWPMVWATGSSRPEPTTTA